MSFENDIGALNAKLNHLNSMMHVIEQNKNVNAFNSNHIICDLCGGYHATYECMQTQNVNYYSEFGHCNSNFDQCNSNWTYDYDWNNQCTYNNSSNFYDVQPHCVQHKSEPFWELAIEMLAKETSDHFDRIENTLYELASHLGRIQEYLNVIGEAILSKHSEFNPRIVNSSKDSEFNLNTNDGNVTC